MIKVSDYYKKACSSIANLDTFTEIHTSSDIFPFEGLYIGKFQSALGHELPALLSFEKINGCCFLSTKDNEELIHRVIQSIVLRIAASLPIGMCKFTLYDGAGLGRNLVYISNLRSEILSNGRIITKPYELLRSLDEITEHVYNVNQNILGFRHVNETLIQLNATQNDRCYPYHFLIISNYPRDFGREHIHTLKKIIENCNKAGVFVIMNLDTSNSDNLDNSHMEILRHMTTIYQKDDRFYINNYINNDLFRKFALSLDASILDRTEEILYYINNKKTYEANDCIKLIDNIPNARNWWERSSSVGLHIPFGHTTQHGIANLRIEDTEGRNSTIVSGITGYGKSVLLHTLITSVAINYSPNEVELYLIDFSGTEFQKYAEPEYALPHARVIAPESEPELGLCVLIKIEEEAKRRQELFARAKVVDFQGYRQKNVLPRILVIIDEFHKLFDGTMNRGQQDEASRIIQSIVSEYRKLGINLILSNQKIGEYQHKIDLGQIKNRIIFQWAETDIGYMPTGMEIIESLTKGECIYTDNNNTKVRCYFNDDVSIKSLLKQIAQKAGDNNIDNNNLYVYNSSAPIYLSQNRKISEIEKHDIPLETKVYIGEWSTISDDHAHIMIRCEQGANILIIGGSDDKIAQGLTINCVKSITMSYNDNMASFIHFNFMIKGNPMELFTVNDDTNNFGHQFIQNGEQLTMLQKIADEIGKRQGDIATPHKHIFLFIYGFENAIAFMKTSKNGWSEMSEHGKLLSHILECGPSVGIFTVLQTKNLISLTQRIDSNSIQNSFNHRIAFQMDEQASSTLINSFLASKLSQSKYGKNRAYYYNKTLETTTKFKPYTIENYE